MGQFAELSCHPRPWRSHLRATPCARSVIRNFRVHSSTAARPRRGHPASASAPRPSDPEPGPPLCAKKRTSAPATPPPGEEELPRQRQGAAAGPQPAGRPPNQLVSERGGRGEAAASRAAEEPEDPAPHCAEGAWVTHSSGFLWLRRSGALGLNRGRKRACCVCCLCCARACVFSFDQQLGVLWVFGPPPRDLCSLAGDFGDLPDSAVDIHRWSLPDHGGGRWVKAGEAGVHAPSALPAGGAPAV